MQSRYSADSGNGVLGALSVFRWKLDAVLVEVEAHLFTFELVQLVALLVRKSALVRIDKSISKAF
jgi:hypothetical protein